MIGSICIYSNYSSRNLSSMSYRQIGIFHYHLIIILDNIFDLSSCIEIVYQEQMLSQYFNISHFKLLVFIAIQHNVVLMLSLFIFPMIQSNFIVAYTFICCAWLISPLIQHRIHDMMYVISKGHTRSQSKCVRLMAYRIIFDVY